MSNSQPPRINGNISQSHPNLNHLQRKERTRYDPQLHLFRCQNSTLESFCCSRCYYSTDILIFLKRHSEKCHIPPDLQNKNLITQCTERKYVCRACSFETNFALKWLRHVIRSCVTHAPEINNRVDIQRIFPRSVQKNKKIFHCQYCPYTTTRHNMKQHMTSNHKSDEEIKWFYCNFCAFRAKTKGSLKNHTLCKHTPAEHISWVNCESCSYRAKDRSHMRKHIIRRHLRDDEIQWYRCKKCPYKGKIKTDLDAHVYAVHTEDKDIAWFKCDQCDYAAKFKAYLKTHIIVKHLKENEVEWHYCDQCSYKAKTVRALSVHKKWKHGEHIETLKCDQCYYRTKRIEALIKHKDKRHMVKKKKKVRK